MTPADRISLSAQEVLDNSLGAASCKLQKITALTDLKVKTCTSAPTAYLLVLTFKFEVNQRKTTKIPISDFLAPD